MRHVLLSIVVASLPNAVRAAPLETIVPFEGYAHSLRYDPPSGRVVVWGGNRAVFVDPVARTSTTWERTDDKPSVRWEREVLGQPMPVLMVEPAGPGSSRMSRYAADDAPGEVVFAPNSHRYVTDAVRGPRGNAAWISVEPSRLEILDGRTGKHRTIYDAAAGSREDLRGWSPDGSYLYVRSTDYDAALMPRIPTGPYRYASRETLRCISRVALAFGGVHRLRCVIGGTLHAVVDRDATRAAIIHTLEDRRVDIELISLPDGARIASAVDLAVPDLRNAVLDERGRLIITDGHKIHVLDVRAGKAFSRLLASGFEHLSNDARLPDGRWLALRYKPRELIAVDIDALVAGDLGPLPKAPVPTATTTPPASIDPFWTAERPCPAGELRREETIAGTRWTCVDGRGRPNGPFAWIVRGRPFISGTYLDGVPYGAWRYWSSRGTLAIAVTRAGDFVTGAFTTWHPNGTVEVESTADTGMHEERYDSGQLRTSGRVVRTGGKQYSVGEHTYWRRDGSVEMRITRDAKGEPTLIVEYPTATERRETRVNKDGSRITKYFRDDVVYAIERRAKGGTTKRTCVRNNIEEACPTAKK